MREHTPELLGEGLHLSGFIVTACETLEWASTVVADLAYQVHHDVTQLSFRWQRSATGGYGRVATTAAGSWLWHQSPKVIGTWRPSFLCIHIRSGVQLKKLWKNNNHNHNISSNKYINNDEHINHKPRTTQTSTTIKTTTTTTPPTKSAT